ncbi:hypothetical protein DE146DRAFT_645368 [Phaeosphaeria sp. MPI-PUGE-AT-0046c]|nr:hypothetical protein DE146DRAFT_645368 [Phaeosphaeria sp. MPI-PUGE-AT-0046c]
MHCRWHHVIVDICRLLLIKTSISLIHLLNLSTLLMPACKSLLCYLPILNAHTIGPCLCTASVFFFAVIHCYQLYRAITFRQPHQIPLSNFPCSMASTKG